MKKKLSVAAVVIAVIVGVYFILAPRPVGDNGTPPSPDAEETLELTAPETDAKEPDETPPENTQAKVTQPTGVEVDERVQRMQEEYAVLERKREELRGRLNKIRGRLWGVELPREQANEATEELKEAFMLLNNPPMLGAFRDVEDVRDEIGRIETADKDLDEIEKLITAAKENPPD